MRTAVIKIGNSSYAIPDEVLALVPQFRQVSNKYDKTDGLTYHFTNDGSNAIEVSFLYVNNDLPAKE